MSAATLFPQLGTRRSAGISPCRNYRYWLKRDWAEVQSRPEAFVCWIMLNPSTADAEVDDATVRKCMAFTSGWGFPGLVVVNLFAWRATNPRQLRHVDDPVGDGNDLALYEAAAGSALVVAAWGNGPSTWYEWDLLLERERWARSTIPTLHHLGLTTHGAHPRHPLYLPLNTPIQVWEP